MSRGVFSPLIPAPAVGIVFDRRPGRHVVSSPQSPATHSSCVDKGTNFLRANASFVLKRLLMIRTSLGLPSDRKGSASTSPWALGLVLAGLLVVGWPTRAVDADTILNSGTTTVTTGTDFGDYLYVATTGTATLEIIAGGYATNAYGYIGYDVGGVGTATVSGGTWANSGDLYVGYQGTGTLNVTGGSVTNTDGYCWGSATVSSGTWANSGTLFVGIGSLNITGGSVTNVDATIGDQGTGSMGYVTVTGGTWATSGDLRVGNIGSPRGGDGTLTMNGGLVSVAGTLTQETGGNYGGFFNAGYGTINLNAGGTLQIGVGGTTGVLVSSTLTNNGTLIFNRSDASTYSGTISGSGAVTKAGAGTLTFSGSNGYTGRTQVNGGVLALSNTSALAGTGTLSFGGGSLQYSASNTVDYSAKILSSGSAISIDTNGRSVTFASGLGASNTGGLTKTGLGTLTLTASNGYTGGTTISSGTLQVGNGGTTGSIAGNVVITATSGADYSLVFNRSDDLTYSGTITAANGPGGMRKLGAGTLTLTGSFQTGAGIKVSEGAVQIGDGGTTGAFNGAVVLENNSSFIYNRSVDLTRYSLLSGTGTLIKRGAGTLTLGGTSNTYSGGTTISGGALATDTSGALPTGGAVTITSGTLDLSGYSATIGTLSGSSGGTITSGSAGSITLTSTSATNSTYAGTITNGLGTMAFTKQGAGTLTLSGTSSYTGATTISGGVLAYGVSNALSNSTAVTVAGGGLGIGSYTDTVASFTITSGSLFGSGKLTAATYALGGGTVAGNLGTGSMTVTANSNLNGTADVISVSLNSGTLALGSAGRFTSNQVALTGSSGASIGLGGTESVGSLAGGFNVALGSATLSTGNDNTSTTYSGILSGSGGLTKAGTGTFTLSGNNTYTGATAVNGGKLLVNGQLGNTAVAVNASGVLGGSGTILGGVTVGSSGTLSPGNSPGVLTVGSLSLLAGSHTLMEITGTSTSLYDQIVSNGSGGLTYGGNLNLVMSGSYADQTTFHLFSNFTSPPTGDFAAVVLDATGDEYAGLTFTGTAGVWTSTWTTNHQRLVFSTATGDLVVVPEPSTYAMALAGLACGGWQMMRRRRLRKAATLEG